MVWIRNHGEKEIIYNIFKKNVLKACCWFLLIVVTGLPAPNHLKNRNLRTIFNFKKYFCWLDQNAFQKILRKQKKKNFVEKVFMTNFCFAPISFKLGSAYVSEDSKKIKYEIGKKYVDKIFRIFIFRIFWNSFWSSREQNISKIKVLLQNF